MSAMLEARNALVVGGAVGIGRAVSLAFAQAGANVFVADNGWPDEKQTLVEQMRAHGGQAMAGQVDVTDEASVAQSVADALDALGHVDIMINNAGVTSAGAPMQDQDWTLWDRIFDINVKGVAFGMKHMLPHMRSRRYGRIINTSSQLAHKPIGNHGAYCASKAAVTALTASVAQEVARDGITINCVCPGMTDTAMLYVGGHALVEDKLRSLPIGRPGTPSEVASVYVYLASDAASFCIGQSFSPNGGDVMW